MQLVNNCCWCKQIKELPCHPWYNLHYVYKGRLTYIWTRFNRTLHTYWSPLESARTQLIYLRIHQRDSSSGANLAEVAFNPKPKITITQSPVLDSSSKWHISEILFVYTFQTRRTSWMWKHGCMTEGNFTHSLRQAIRIQLHCLEHVFWVKTDVKTRDFRWFSECVAVKFVGLTFQFCRTDVCLTWNSLLLFHLHDARLKDPSRTAEFRQ